MSCVPIILQKLHAKETVCYGHKLVKPCIHRILPLWPNEWGSQGCSSCYWSVRRLHSHSSGDAALGPRSQCRIPLHRCICRPPSAHGWKTVLWIFLHTTAVERSIVRCCAYELWPYRSDSGRFARTVPSVMKLLRNLSLNWLVLVPCKRSRRSNSKENLHRKIFLHPF